MDLKRLLGIAPSIITKEQALEIAKKECIKRGWTWREPVKITTGWRNYHIRTNTEAMGCNCAFLISKTNGEIIRAGFLPR